MQKTVPWEAYQKAGLLTIQQVESIRKYEINSNNKYYLDMFCTLLQNLTRNDTIQSILVLFDEIVEKELEISKGSEGESGTKGREGVPEGGLFFDPFFKLLDHSDEFIQLKSAKILVSLFVLNSTNPNNPNDPTPLFKYLILLISSSDSNLVDLGLQLLGALCSIESFPSIFYQTHGSMQALLSVLQSHTQSQIQYESIYLIWLLSFTCHCADLESSFHIIGPLKDIANTAIKEKVIRVIMATFKNLILKAPQATIIPMLGLKLLPTIEILSVRKWSDGEILEDMNLLRDQLGKHVASLSTWDEYKSEIDSGRLEWSPPHQSEVFWKVNGSKFQENQYSMVHTLVKLISSSQDVIILAVACHDIGQFVKYGGHDAKKILDKNGGKTAVMMLMAHENGDVRYQALAAVQQMMMNSF